MSYKDVYLHLDFPSKATHYFGNSDPYARAWSQMYEEMIAGGNIFTENELAGYACFYRGLAHAWTLRQYIIENEFDPEFFDAQEWEEIYNSLDPIQATQIKEYCVKYKENRDEGYRCIAGYLRTSQTWSMRNILLLEEIEPQVQESELKEFQLGLDIAHARWQVLTTLA